MQVNFWRTKTKHVFETLNTSFFLLSNAGIMKSSKKRRKADMPEKDNTGMGERIQSMVEDAVASMDF